MLNKNGFTLIELLVVVLIIGVLAAIALPKYLLAVEKARAAEGLMLIRQVADANKRYRLLNGGYTNDIRKLELDQDFPGELDLTTGTPTRRTKFFSIRAGAAGSTYNPDGSTGIAVGRRNPNAGNGTEGYYVFTVFPEHNVYCDDGTHDKICATLGF